MIGFIELKSVAAATYRHSIDTVPEVKHRNFEKWTIYVNKQNETFGKIKRVSEMPIFSEEKNIFAYRHQILLFRIQRKVPNALIEINVSHNIHSQ